MKRVFPHRFRQTFATWATESGAREIDVQLLLGHFDLTMTQRYARAHTSEQAVRARAELSPVARVNAASPYAPRFGPSVGIPAHALEVTHQIAPPTKLLALAHPRPVINAPTTWTVGESVIETRRRSIAKAASWRIVATLITASVALILTGSIETAIEIGALDAIFKLATFYGHERAWLRIPYGRPRPPEYRI